MTTMIERVAIAISGAPFPSAKSLAKARAVIEALREPTDEMLSAAYEAMFDDKWNGTQAPMMDAAHKAMIDAILTEGQETL